MAIKIQNTIVIDNDRNIINVANVAGTLTTAAQPNVTSVGTLTSLAVTGNISGGNVAGGNSVTANFLTGTLTTAAQPNVTSVGTLTGLGVTGNITAGNVNGGNLVSANFFTGTLTTAAQPNVTSVGTLTDLSVTGNISGGNLNTAGQVVASSLESNVSTGTSPLIVASTTLVANLNADLLDGYNSSITAVANTVVVRDANANVAANVFTGNSIDVTGNAIIGGNLVVSGNIIYTNITDLNISDPVIGLGRGPNNTPLTTNDGKDRGTEMWYYTTSEKSAFFGYDNSTGKLFAATDITNTADVITVNAYGNLVVGGLEADTISATSASLTSLGVTGNITSGNVSGTTGAFTNVSGNGSALTALNASNITTGTLDQARLANASLTVNGTSITLGGSGTVTANATTLTGTSLNSTVVSSSLTSVGTLGSLSVTGNIDGGNISTVGTATIGTVQTATLTTGANTTAGNITGNWTLTAGSRLEATYADLAERYRSDHPYQPGTILMIGGSTEVTIADVSGKYRLAGIVSTAPAYVLNSTIDNSVIVALTGRVPCRVVGKIAKGDLITISHLAGVGTSAAPPASGTVVGRALESYDSDEVGVIEVKVDQC